MDPVLNQSSVTVRTTRAQTVLRDMATASGLVDIWQIQNSTSRDYMFFSSPHNLLSRKDLFLISQSLVSAALGDGGAGSSPDPAAAVEMMLH